MELKRSKTLINRKYTEYFIPTVLTAMANNIAVMVDATIVGNLLGSAELASVRPCFKNKSCTKKEEMI